MIVNSCLIIVGFIIFGIIAIREPNSGWWLKEDHIRDLVPTVFVQQEGSWIISLNPEGTLFCQESCQGWTSGTTIQPKNQRIIFWWALRLNEPVMELPPISSIQVTRIVLEGDIEGKAWKIGHLVRCEWPDLGHREYGQETKGKQRLHILYSAN